MSADTVYHDKEPRTPKTRNKRKKEQKIKETEYTDNEETMDVRIKQISDEPDKIAPIIAYFSSGYDPSAKTPDSNDVDGQVPRVTVYRHKAETKSKRLQVVVSPPGSSVEFVGSNYTGEGATRQTCVYTLGVLDKERQTLKIVPVASNKIFRLEPRVKVSESVDPGASSSMANADLTKAERAEKARKLNNIYGTKGAINRDKKLFALNPGDDPESQKFLDKKLNEAEIKKEALESTSAIVARNIPPYNEAATSPREAYPLDQIILKGEWDFLQDVYRLLQGGTGVLTDSYPIFVRNRIYKLGEIQDEMEKKTLSCVFSFITHLIKFKDVHSMDGLSTAKGHKFPGIIRQRFKNMFAESESKKLPLDKINLLISYVLVLTLYADEFKTDTADIAKDLRMSIVDLRKHFENLGCKFSKEKSVLLATLPVPLKFPQQMRRRRR